MDDREERSLDAAAPPLDALAQALSENFSRLYAAIYRILRDPDEAADALQDACLLAHRKLDQFEGRANMGAWLHRIAVNAALERLRKRKRRNESEINELMPEYDRYGVLLGDPDWKEATPEKLLLAAETRATVTAAIEQLPEAYRSVLVLRDIEELDTATVAEMLDCTQGTVKTRLHRARFALKKLLTSLLQEGSDP